jgi:YidC/Oxa1 family membrane protein insertase
MTSLFGVPVDGAYHLVLGLTNALTPVLGGLAAVAGIIVFTMAIRLLVMPLSFRALRGQAAIARLSPRVQQLRQRYARQPERLQRELNALYTREGTGLLGGFVPLLAQWPVFSVLYLLFRSPSVAGAPNRLLSSHLFGVPLGDHWLSGSGVLSAQGAVFFGVLAVLAVVCWLSARVARRMTAATAAAAAAAGPAAGRPAPARRGSAGGSARARSSAAGPAAAGAGAGRVAGLLGKVLPYLTVVIAAFAPLAAAVYLVVSTGWSVAERWVFTRARHREAVGEGGQDGQNRQGGQNRQDRQGGGQISGDPPRTGNKVGGRAHRP